MGCETGNCPECKIEVGAINVIPPKGITNRISTRPFYHLFILYTDGDKRIIYRGGPELGNKYSELAAEGRATEWKVDGSEFWDTEIIWGALVTHRMEGTVDNPDYIFMVDSIVIAEGPDFCGLDEKFSKYTREIAELGLEYEPISLLSTDNSNATIRTILHYMDLPERRPDGGRWVDTFGFEWDQPAAFAPGWGHIFNLGER